MTHSTLIHVGGLAEDARHLLTLNLRALTDDALARFIGDASDPLVAAIDGEKSRPVLILNTKGGPRDAAPGVDAKSLHSDQIERLSEGRKLQ